MLTTRSSAIIIVKHEDLRIPVANLVVPKICTRSQSFNLFLSQLFFENLVLIIPETIPEQFPHAQLTKYFIAVGSFAVSGAFSYLKQSFVT